MNHLCDTAINTIRIIVYRSVITDEPIVTAACLRIGKNGAWVDNGHAGGVSIGISLLDGTLGKSAYDQYGNEYKVWNNVNFAGNNFQLPNWETIVAFAKEIGRKVIHHRLLALDVALQENEKPILIEYNLTEMSYWLHQYTGQSFFGEYTDEVIEYCKNFHEDWY